MALTLYLAMTAAELQNCCQIPEHIAWMACHFSPYSSGLSNVPVQLPAGSVLILNDRIPPQGHDPELVARQLQQAAEALAVGRVLLDFQRPGCPETAAIAKAAVAGCPCPVGVTVPYAQELDCPVFWTPQLRRPLSEQLENWPGREIWLEAALDCEVITITETDSVVSAAQLPKSPPDSRLDSRLHCRYFTEPGDDRVQFTVWRDLEALHTLLAAAETQGITCAVGLYQQLAKKTAEDS